MKGATLCGFLLDELVAVAKILHEHPELLNDLKDGYRVGYEQGRQEAFAEIERATNRCMKAISTNSFPFTSTGGGLDAQAEPIKQPTIAEAEKPF